MLVDGFRATTQACGYGSRIGVRLHSLVRDDAGVSFQIQLSYSERMCVRVLAARCARGLRHLSPSWKVEGAGKTGCALHPRSRVQNTGRRRTRAYRFSGGNPAFPARWFTAYFALSPVTGLSCHRHRRNDFRQLDTSVGVSGPHDFAVRIGIARLARRRVHRIPPRRP